MQMMRVDFNFSFFSSFLIFNFISYSLYCCWCWCNDWVLYTCLILIEVFTFHFGAHQHYYIRLWRSCTWLMCCCGLQSLSCGICSHAHQAFVVLSTYTWWWCGQKLIVALKIRATRHQIYGSWDHARSMCQYWELNFSTSTGQVL